MVGLVNDPYLSGINPLGSPVPGHPGGDGVGADLHIEADIAAADGFDLVRGVSQDLGRA